MPARTFVLIFKCVARPNFCEPPPSQSRHHVRRQRRERCRKSSATWKESAVWQCSGIEYRADNEVKADKICLAIKKLCKNNRKLKKIVYFCSLKIGFKVSVLLERAWNFKEVKLKMIVELIINQMFTKPLKMRGNLKNVFFVPYRKWSASRQIKSDWVPYQQRSTSRKCSLKENCLETKIQPDSEMDKDNTLDTAERLTSGLAQRRREVRIWKVVRKCRRCAKPPSR
jgi:hypothetical protein